MNTLRYFADVYEDWNVSFTEHKLQSEAKHRFTRNHTN